MILVICTVNALFFHKFLQVFYIFSLFLNNELRKPTLHFVVGLTKYSKYTI